MRKPLSLVLLVIGLVLGPGYWVYGKFYTGSEALLMKLTADTPGPDGIQHWRSEPFQLHTDMAPAGLIILAQGHFSPNMDENKPPKDLYTATLSKGEEAAKPLGFTLGVKHVSDSNPAFREHLVLMHQIQPGDYRLEVTSVNPPSIQIDSMQLQVRQHLHEPDPRLVTAGIVSFVLGLLGLLAG